MFRTRLGAALTASALIATLTITGSGSTLALDDPLKRFERLDLNTVQLAGGFKPASLASDRQSTVILELAGASVSKRSAEAKKQGKELSKAERDAIRASLKSNQDSLRGRVAAAGANVLFDYQSAYNGLAVRVALKDIAALQSLPGVVAVHPSRTFKLDNTLGVQYIEGDDAWNDTGKTGNDVKIAVLDTGVDYFHANFGGSGDPAQFADDNHTIAAGTFPTAKVVAGTDFVGDDYDASSDDPAASTPRPDPDPVDCNGHGSHVAGTAAGFGVLDSGATYTGPYNASTYSNTFRIGPGVAPRASIIALRIFGCAGSTSEAIIVEALEFAFDAEADVVNMSLGSPFGRDDEPSTVASNSLAAAGVVVVASSGNEGASAYMTGAPAVASQSISVAAVDTSGAMFPGANAALSTGNTILMQNSNGAALPLGARQIAVLRTSYPSGPVSLGCDPAEYTGFPGGGVSGKLVVTVRGTCARVARAIFGQQAGAAAVAMVDTTSGYPPFEGEITSNPDTGEPFTVTIPFLGVRGVLGTPPPPATDTTDGDDLVAADGGTATLTAATVPNPGYKNFAGFTSGGPANVDSDMKPEVTAPGVSVLSTAVGTGNRGSRISGTSMAAPHTAGVAALVTEAHPTWSTERIKSAVVHTADATAAKIGNYNTRLGGSGVVDARKAVDSIGIATTSGGSGTLSFGYEALAAEYSETLPLTLENLGTSDITYNIAAAFNANLGVTASFSPSGPVTVGAGAGRSETVQVTLRLTAAGVAALPAAEASNFGGLATVRGAVTATPTTAGTGIYQLRVPFMLVPRGRSALTAGPKSAYTRSGSTFTANVPLNNTGIHSGDADVYAWGISDTNDVGGGFLDDPMDIRAVGVQAFELGGGSTDRLLVFAINGWGSWSNPSVNEFDIAIDSKGNSAPEFFVVGVDLGAVTTGVFNGQFAAFVFDAAGNALVARRAIAPMNGSTVLLPVLASELGLGNNSTKFNYSVAGFSIVPGTLIDTTGVASFRSHQPPVSTGNFVTVGPRGSSNVTVTVDQGKNAGTPQLGWMVVTLDDANGEAQADLISIGTLR